jgi:predicted MFS family arabinose efflux permease
MTASMKKSSILAILGLSGFVVMADNWVVSPILPSIATGIGVDAVRAGLLITAYMIPFGVFQLVFGPLADRFGKRQVITVAMIAFTLGTGLSALGATLTGLALYRALTGVFAASVMPISLALIGDLFPMAERQGAIGTFMGVSFLGQGLSMAIGGTIAYLVSWRGVFATYAGLSVIATALLLSIGSRIPSQRNPQSRMIAPFAGLLTKRASVLTYVVVLLEGILILGSFSYLGAYIARNYHFDNLIIGLIMTAFGVMAVLGGRLSGRLAARFGRRSVLAAGLLMACGADAVVFLGGGVLLALIAGVGLLGIGFMLAHSTLLTIATEFASSARGMAMSLVAFAFMGGGGIGTALGGRLIRAGGFSLLYGTYSLALAVLVVFAIIVVRDVGSANAKPVLSPAE